jgi:deazaflavin-dependent oxidoreductase (nitroreductase family)
MSDWNTSIIEEFRANNGTVGGPFEGAQMLLLTTTGAKSGEPRLVPLVYLPDDGKYVVIASKGGAPTNPDWYHNLIANPNATVDLGTEAFEVQATEVYGDERRRLYDAQAKLRPAFAEYEKQTTRTIPVLVLKRVS